MFLRELSKQEQSLIISIQEVGFGHIEFVTVKDGKPVFTEETQKVANIKLSGMDERHIASRTDGDFQLKKEQDLLIQTIRRQKNGVIRSIKVYNGLPTDMVMAEGFAL